MRRQLSDSLINKPLPKISTELQKHCFIEFGGIEEHFKYPDVNFPVFDGYNHMQYQIRDPKGFADMLIYIFENDTMPTLPFLK